MKKNNKLSFVLLICGTFFIVVSLVLGFVFANTSKFFYKVDEIKVVVNSPSDEYYNISIDLTLHNNSGKNNNGSITLLLEDGDGKRVNASFGTITEFDGKKQFKNLTNTSVQTSFADSENGLGYDIKVVGVTIGTQKYVKSQSFNIVFAFPMIAGAIVVVVAFALREAKQSPVEQDLQS